MAKPLNVTSTDVDGYLQQLIESLTDEESVTHEDEFDSSCETQPSEPIDGPTELEMPAESNHHSVSLPLNDGDRTESDPSTELSGPSEAVSPADRVEKPTSPPVEKIYNRAAFDLVPRPTGSADTISEFREVANLMVKDALNTHRCRELISNAYGMFAFAIVCLLTAMLCSFFGVSQPGLARLIALASVALGGLGTCAYAVLLFVITRSNRKVKANRSTNSLPNGSSAP